mmetsp:Transcript_3663/g.4274  ORF Transcript_3663/g.4274 Transcript_3663/m.4274 type:complete len:237 (+) Transcript_3663:22-732(+)
MQNTLVKNSQDLQYCGCTNETRHSSISYSERSLKIQNSEYEDNQKELTKIFLPWIKLLDNYCNCEIFNNPTSATIKNSENFSFSNSLTEEIKESKEDKNSILVQRKSHPRKVLNRTEYLGALLQKLNSSLDKAPDSETYLIKAKEKLKYKTETISDRRSRYTGVFKNCSRWQALIAIRKKKTYIQTYSSEYEAARAFDLVSIILKGFSSITNFSYTKKEVKRLLEEYGDIVAKFCY